MNDSPSLRSPLQDRNKKLINLSRQVLDHVKSTEKTTGNQIAKEIIKGFSDEVYEAEFKNIQRRVYDALNVLHALSIISKNRNEIKYHGLVDRNDLVILQHKILQKKKTIEDKRKNLGENLIQYVALHKLIRKNQQSSSKVSNIEIPCIIVSGPKKSSIKFSDESVVIASESPYRIMSECHVMAGMNMHRFNDEEISEHFPKDIFNVFDESSVKTNESSEKNYKELYFKINNYFKSE